MKEQNRGKKVRYIWGYVFGVIFLLGAFGGLLSAQWGSIFILLLGLFLLPPSYKYFSEKMNKEISLGKKILIGAMLFVCFMFTIDNESSSINKDNNIQEVSENEEDIQNSTNVEASENVKKEEDLIEINEENVMVPAKVVTEEKEKEKKKAKKKDEEEAQGEELGGMNISRTSLTSVLEKTEIGFSFEKGAPVDGEENYTGTSGGAMVQLIGPKNNLKKAYIMALLGNDTQENALSLLKVIGFANIVDSDASRWVSDIMEEVAKDNTRDYKVEQIFGDKNFRVVYAPSGYLNSFLLEVTAVK